MEVTIMGEARRRGTFEQRKEQAIARGRAKVAEYAHLPIAPIRRRPPMSVALALAALAMSDRQNTQSANFAYRDATTNGE